MKHFACTLASPRQTVEVDAEDYLQAMHLGAAKIGTKRVSSIYVREIPEPTHSNQELSADTEDWRDRRAARDFWRD
jgi:hypothetical protein